MLEQNFNPFGEEQQSSALDAGMNIPVIVSDFKVEEVEGPKYSGPAIDVVLSQVDEETSDLTGKSARLRFFPYDIQAEIENFNSNPKLDWARKDYTVQSWVKLQFNQRFQMWLLDILRVHVSEKEVDEIKALMAQRTTATDAEADLRTVGAILSEAVMKVSPRPIVYLAYGYKKGKDFPGLPYEHRHCKSWLSPKPVDRWPGNPNHYRNEPWGDERESVEDQEVTAKW